MKEKLKLAATDGSDAMPAPRKAGKPTGDVSKKLTVRIYGELDYRLSSIAKQRGIPAAALALEFLEAGCDRYGLNAEFKALYAKIMAKTAEKATEAA